jgi:hypothetical protein
MTETVLITKRLKESREDAKEAVETLTKIFKAEKYKRSYLALSMLETMSKQGSLDFHEYLSKDEFMKEFIK